MQRNNTLNKRIKHNLHNWLLINWKLPAFSWILLKLWTTSILLIILQWKHCHPSVKRQSIQENKNQKWNILILWLSVSIKDEETYAGVVWEYYWTEIWFCSFIQHFWQDDILKQIDMWDNKPQIVMLTLRWGHTRTTFK